MPIKKNLDRVEREVKENLITYLVAAFGFVAGLAWNDAVKALIEYFFPVGQNGLVAKFIYAIFVTFILVVVTIILQRLIRQKNNET